MERSLIYDIGSHHGEDTAYYLAKGFRVIAIDADPKNLNVCKERFRKESESGRVIFLNGAIIPADCELDQITFFRNKNTSVWGTVDRNWAERNVMHGTTLEEITVPTLRLEQVLARFGLPYYMKIDIEGADQACLESLKKFGSAPEYISIETNKTNLPELEVEFASLRDLGYRKFQLRQQQGLDKLRERIKTLSGESVSFSFERHSSGPFGDDLPDEWREAEACLAACSRFHAMERQFGDASKLRQSRIGGKLLRGSETYFGVHLPGWYDTHAKL